MQGLLKTWRLAAVQTTNKEKGEKPKIDRAVRILRKGAIPRAGKALESKGLGDMDDPDIWNQIDGKHPGRKRRIPEMAYRFKAEEEL